jgi:hypothetical protein
MALVKSVVVHNWSNPHLIYDSADAYPHHLADLRFSQVNLSWLFLRLGGGIRGGFFEQLRARLQHFINAESRH